ncbi:MAG TPA: serine/threonine-protein kinase [Kofleriaceae bacterium]|nr:serine/threonine-protein kinase [Kofleriaceae bacterium]
MTADRGDRTGQVIGQRFRLDALIGRGAMAEVYRAVDLETQGLVALKILKQGISGDASAKLRFTREADVQAKLRHRNIAALYATGITEQAEPYLVVELLRGKTLRNVLKAETRIPPQRAASYTWQALQGLAVVHRGGVLHRDLKPANLMLEPSPGPIERVVLIDFGFATLEGAAKLTQQGTVVGSLAYIAPERLRGELPDQRSDLYSMGVILFEMLSGEPPFKASTQVTLIELQLDAEPPPLDAAVPEAMRAIVDRALAKYQEDRYPDATAMARAIEDAARTLT